MFSILRWLFAPGPPPVPGRLSMVDASTVLDGGSIIVDGLDECGNRRRLTLSQRLLPRSSWRDPVPGRLYIDGWLVPKRGEVEQAIVNLLVQVCNDLEGGGMEQDDIAGELKMKLEFVQSGEYTR